MDWATDLLRSPWPVPGRTGRGALGSSMAIHALTRSYARSGMCTKNSGMSGSPSMNVPFFFPLTEKRRTR